MCPFQRCLPVLLATLAVVVGCGEGAPPAPPPLEVSVAEAIVRDQPVVLEMVGETQGSSDIPIRARVDGVLIGMHFTEGRRVKEGQLLYTIDPVPFESKVVEARGHLAEARTQLAKARADLERIRPLAEMKAVSQQDLDGAVAQHDAAVGAVQAAQARLEQANIELGYTKIHSPIDGRIGISEAKVGEYVGKNPNPVVLNFVSQTDPIRVRFSIDERRYLAIARRIRELEGSAERPERTGNLELVLADGTIHPHRGSTVATDAAVDPRTGTFTLEADFPNPEDLVLAGQFARVRAEVQVIQDAVLVPQRSVTELQGLFRVFVVGEDGVVELRPVELGPEVDQLRVVTGVEAGERVALETMRLQPEMKVVPKLVELDDAGRPVEPKQPGKPKAPADEQAAEEEADA
ncbi:MAG: efflux RND transporter periplasmic adaptor subunit [Myxococcota bacterium]